MSNYHPLQQRKPPQKCIKCNALLDFGGTYCWECSSLIREQERKEEKAMRESYCPFCKKLIGSHKENESQRCLYNLRGYVDIDAQRSRS